MRFLVKFVLLVSVRKDIDFFSMYDEGFLIIRTNLIEGALAYLKGGAPIDAVVFETGWDDERAKDLCDAIKKCKPRVKILALSTPDRLLVNAASADAVLGEVFTEVQLASALVDLLVEPDARDTWFSGAPRFASAGMNSAHA